jgi:phage-related protein
MAVETFNWCPIPGASVDYEFSVITAGLGDGYEQEAAQGINNVRQVWTLSFDGDAARVKAITDFVLRHQGFKHFLWTPPGETAPLKFKAKTPKRTLNGGYQTLSLTFRQHFGP